MMEVELLAQTMALLAGSDLRGTKDQLCVSDGGVYIAQDTATKIGENYDWFWSVQSGLRLLAGTTPGTVNLGVGGWAFLARESGVSDESGLVNEIFSRSEMVDSLITQALDCVDRNR